MSDPPMSAAARTLWASVGFASYVLVGYPALVAVWAKLRPLPVQSCDVTPTVTMVIPCYDEADVIAAKIDNLRALDYPSSALEIVIVDDGSRDGTAEIARQRTRTDGHAISVWSHSQRLGKAEALNSAIAATTGDIVVLSDATAQWLPDALRRLVRPFGDPEVGVVSGAMVYETRATGSAVNVYWRYEDALRRWETASGSTVGVNGNVFAIRRADVVSLNSTTVNDELTLALHAASMGRRVVFEPGARVVDVPSPSMSVERRRRSRITAGRLSSMCGPARPLWKRPGVAFRFASHKLSRPFVPLAGVIAMGASLAIVAQPSVRRSAAERRMAQLVVLTSMALLAGAAGGWWQERRGRTAPLVCRLSHLVLTGCAASVSGLVKAAAGRQTATWDKRPPEASVPAMPNESAATDHRAGRAAP